MILRLWLFVVLACVGAFAPSRACARTAETRAWDFFATATNARPESAAQAAGTHHDFAVCGYELAPGSSHAAETTAVRNGSFSVIDWTGYPANLPKPAGPMTLLETGSEELVAAQRAKAVINNELREAFGLRGVEMDIHELQPVKFGGSPTDLSNKLLIPRDLHQQVVTPFWNQLQQDIAPYVYRAPGT